jgi:hypothetical protein
VKSFLSLSSVILSVASIVLWRLVYAFIEKEECSKEEEACRQSWEIAQIPYCAGRLEPSRKGRHFPRLPFFIVFRV